MSHLHWLQLPILLLIAALSLSQSRLFFFFHLLVSHLPSSALNSVTFSSHRLHVQLSPLTPTALTSVTSRSRQFHLLRPTLPALVTFFVVCILVHLIHLHSWPFRSHLTSSSLRDPIQLSNGTLRLASYLNFQSNRLSATLPHSLHSPFIFYDQSKPTPTPSANHGPTKNPPFTYFEKLPKSKSFVRARERGRKDEKERAS